jgi:hypothetical protein
VMLGRVFVDHSDQAEKRADHGTEVHAEWRARGSESIFPVAGQSGSLAGKFGKPCRRWSASGVSGPRSSDCSVTSSSLTSPDLLEASVGSWTCTSMRH